MFLLRRMDEIHQQLEEQLAVLSRFIDGVANLRPKGASLSLVFILFVLLFYDLLHSCHVPKVTSRVETICRLASYSGTQYSLHLVYRQRPWQNRQKKYHHCWIHNRIKFWLISRNFLYFFLIVFLVIKSLFSSSDIRISYSSIVDCSLLNENYSAN